MNKKTQIYYRQLRRINWKILRLEYFGGFDSKNCGSARLEHFAASAARFTGRYKHKFNPQPS